MLDTEEKERAAEEVLGDTPAWIAAYCAAETRNCGTDEPGDASGFWSWYDGQGQVIKSLPDGFVDWRDGQGALGPSGFTAFCAVRAPWFMQQTWTVLLQYDGPIHLGLWHSTTAAAATTSGKGTGPPCPAMSRRRRRFVSGRTVDRRRRCGL